MKKYTNKGLTLAIISLKEGNVYLRRHESITISEVPSYVQGELRIKDVKKTAQTAVSTPKIAPKTSKEADSSSDQYEATGESSDEA